MAKLLKDIYGASGGAVYPRVFAAGEDCPEDLEEAAREMGAIKGGKAKAAPENKAESAAPENKAAGPVDDAGGDQDA